ncbi:MULTISPECIES: helix-turn-helix domain-containing protein [Brenneria]|uniref:XRE family transcriptional regulator n=1 Tax=Brenneria nigrifluens DSM 30175 = ATCC 13028 TaxID=1121120 RepID=A0A2U1UNR8_9GAMM|nr:MULTISPECIES: helix-turn-helix transcriptional regulator [Brenneria]PWC23319.1 XRE family transcriptional regulator [Brenneria nigrifluens DSM 30175 = ATCC 13028]QCR02894.1 XRE family transcriptional regulator [Brenneria nigrifluens DSM 30175 = ATCC 13028]
MNKVSAIAQVLSQRRKALGMEQKDMYMRIGMKQQQYQRIEAGSDVKLSTLLRVLEGLNLQLSITPIEAGESLQPPDHSSVSKTADMLEDDSDDLQFWFGSEDKQHGQTDGKS